MRIVKSLTAIVPEQPLGSRFLENQRRMTTKLNWRNNIVKKKLKRQIKNRTLHTSRLFLLTKFITHSWYTSNIEPANKKPPVINIHVLSDLTLVSDCGCKGEDNKITTMLYYRCFVYKIVKSSHLCFEKNYKLYKM